MARFFLWDGKSYGDFFITSRKINDHILSSTREGSILELHTYSVLKQNPPLIFLRSFGVVETVTYIMNTPLSLETLPKPITLLGFESYLSSISKLFVRLCLQPVSGNPFHQPAILCLSITKTSECIFFHGENKE